MILNRVTRHTSESTGHGRLETRVCTVVSYGPVMEPMFKDKFAGLRSIVGMKSERIILATGERTEETRYYITSLENTNPEEIANAIRQHWSIETICIGNWMLPSGKTTARKCRMQQEISRQLQKWRSPF